MKWSGHVARVGEMKSTYKILVWKPEGKRPFGRPKRRCEDNIITDLTEIDLENLPGCNSLRIGTSGEPL
jgi:hypothetical protein